jgi:hypothetical protein
VLVEQLAERGRVDLRELFADATFIRDKKGTTMSVRPRLTKG